MKKLARLFTLALVSVPLFAQTPDPICEGDARINLYTEYYNNKSKKDAAGNPDPAAQKYAYEASKQFLEKYAEKCPDKYTDAIRKYVQAYDAATDRYDLARASFSTKPDPAKAFEIGRRILSTTADDLGVLMTLAHAGNAALTAKNETYVAEALTDAKKAIEQIEAGKAPSSWSPYKGKDDALSYLYYYTGNLAFASKDTADAARWFYKATTVEGPMKSDPVLYGKLAVAYQLSQLDAMHKDFNEKFGGKQETPEGKFALDQLNQVVDRIMDGYARAVALSGDDARYTQAKAAWLESLRSYYKFRIGETLAGFDEYLAQATTRPLPAPFEPKVYVPEPVVSKKH